MIKFGTGGWRAIIGDDFTKANVQLLTAALARKMKAEGADMAGFVVGYDRRFLSVEAARWAAEVMAGEGIPCKLVNREAQRLKLSLDAAKELQAACGKPILCFLHFPPVWNDTPCEPFITLLREYGIRKCYFGHIHGAYDAPPCFDYAGISFAIIAADYLNFIPRIIFPPEV